MSKSKSNITSNSFEKASIPGGSRENSYNSKAGLAKATGDRKPTSYSLQNKSVK